MSKKTIKHKKKINVSFDNKGFSLFLVLVVVVLSIFLAGAFQKIKTINPIQGIVDPNNTFDNIADKKSLQIKTLNFVTPTPSPTPAAVAQPSLCQEGGANNESKILAAYSPANGQAVGATGQIKVWVNDEGAPIIAPGEIVGADGKITTIGDRTAKAADNYLWEPALYISPQTAESGGTPFFPTAIKGDYNSSGDTNFFSDRGGVNVSGMEPVPGNPQLDEQYTAEYIWDVASLKLAPGNYTAEFVIHDGDHDRGVGCISITIQ